MRPDKVVVLADACERAEEIDVTRAEEAKRRAQEALKTAATGVDAAVGRSGPASLPRSIEGSRKDTPQTRRRNKVKAEAEIMDSKPWPSDHFHFSIPAYRHSSVILLSLSIIPPDGVAAHCEFKQGSQISKRSSSPRRNEAILVND